MLTTSELLFRLRERGVRNIEIARALNLADSRVVELYAGKRSLKLDEAACLVETFGLEDDPPAARTAVRLSDRVAANIQRLREASGLSRPQLAERCRPTTSPQQIERLEKGERRMSLDWLERIAHALNVDPMELVTGTPTDWSGLSREVATEVALALGVIGSGRGRPEEATVNRFRLVLSGLADLFSRHPEACHNIEVARPAIDLLTRQNEQANGGS
ncbi:hypothetical protein GCM10022276_01400 [Sphingomonas limnosediminicola]|uniref:HTH cro/C1-type domain-containing protein n=1 Tax=Sphingomonas limnosediminicola TaxID=940133 RepID=A0ABP7KRC7_9SPHN